VQILRGLVGRDDALHGSGVDGGSDAAISSGVPGGRAVTQLLDFDPVNELENRIVQARAGSEPADGLLPLLAEAELFVSSRAEVMEDGSGFEPLLFESPAGPLVGIFSESERAVLHRAEAEYLVQMHGHELFLRMPPGYGLIVNPGYRAQLIISADTVRSFKAAL
jgi:hypothetical protein